MKNLKLKNRISGFTLVELLVVIAIISILATVSIGGYNYSIKRVAIANDKALVNQINRVIDTYEIYYHNEEKISQALWEEFGNKIVVQSYEFEYDIYYNTDIEEFELLKRSVYANNEGYISISHYLNLQHDGNSTIANWKINEKYSKYNSNSNYSKMNKLISDIGIEYELEIAINSKFDEDKYIDDSHTIKLKDLIYYNDHQNLSLSYQLNKHSVVNYDKVTCDFPKISNGEITFSYPGTYYLDISDGNITTTIKISIFNTYYTQIGKLSINNFNVKCIESINGDSYNLRFPIFQYLSVEDYHYTEQETYTYMVVALSNYDDKQKALVEQNRISVQVNAMDYQIEKIGNYYYVTVTDITENENEFTIIYNYQGFNGKWAQLTQNIKITRKSNGNIIIN